MTISIFIVWLLSVYTIGVLSGIAFCCLSKWLKECKEEKEIKVITIDEAIFCEKSYIGETDCKDCKYYGTDTCKSRESHKLAINTLELTKISLNKKCKDDKNSGFKILIEDKETYKKVTERMDKEGIKWRVTGYLASDPMYYKRLPIYLLIDKYNRLSWSDSDVFNEGYKEITPEKYLKGNKIMTKADLKDWMIVEDNLERRYIVDKIHGCFLQYNYTNNYISNMDNFNDDLHDSVNEHYITKVFDPTTNELSHILDGYSDVIPRNIIWEREEPVVEMSISEIEEKLGIKNLKIVEEKKNDQ